LLTPATLRLIKSISPVKTDTATNFKDINSVLKDFQKHESKFINRFVKESDNVSLKINRFTAAVMPPTEKISYSTQQKTTTLQTEVGS
jgi:hypothetical protein